MTILDDLFKEANGLWAAIRGTADRREQVVVDAEMVEIPNSRLDGRERGFNIRSPDTLVYNPASPLNSASFVGSELTIFAPGLHASTGHGPTGATVVDSPDYGILLAKPHPDTSTAATDETGTLIYFPLSKSFVAVSLSALRLE